MVLGALIVLVVIFFPDGLQGALNRLISGVRRLAS
jgi:ABC-type branched-subunit amino acid transport system permease subunit